MRYLRLATSEWYVLVLLGEDRALDPNFTRVHTLLCPLFSHASAGVRR
jgi:hypothetical protein